MMTADWLASCAMELCDQPAPQCRKPFSRRNLVAQAFDRLKQLAGGWHEIDPSDTIREAAVRFLRVHPQRAADAVQMAAAFIAAERRPSSLELVTLDDHLAAAARKEGFTSIDVPSTE